MESSRNLFLIFLALALLALVPRFYELGSLGFYGDEDVTSLPSRAYAETGESVFPSGMPYHRAYPHTVLNAASAKLFGLDNDFSYRVPSAILGALTVLLLFFMGRRFFDTPTALVAAILMALSAWHVEVSREARMYGPFLFFYTLSAFSVWLWAIEGKWRYLLLALVAFIGSCVFHELSLIGAALVLIPLMFASWSKVKLVPLAAFSIFMAATSYLYRELFVVPPFFIWQKESGTVSVPEPSEAVAAAAGLVTRVEWLPEPVATMPVVAGILFSAGAALGLWVAHQCRTDDAAYAWPLRKAALCVAAALTGGLVFSGFLHGAFMAAVVFLILHPDGIRKLSPKLLRPFIVLLLVSAAWLVVSTLELGLVAGIKELVMRPFPYIAYLLQMLMGVTVLFLLALLYYAMRGHHHEENAARACLLAALVPLLVASTLVPWGGMRILVGLYPFMLLIAALALLGTLKQLGRWSGYWGDNGAAVLAVLVALSGILGGHGIPQAATVVNIENGDKLPALIFSERVFYPDHRGVGQYVRANRQPGDIVIAEDPLQMAWYAGGADYWLKSLKGHAESVYKTPDGKIRYLYDRSVLLTQKEMSYLASYKKGHVWLVTSGETANKVRHNLSPLQQDWLNNVRATVKPSFVGRDNASMVYCLNCDVGSPMKERSAPESTTPPG